MKKADIRKIIVTVLGCILIGIGIAIFVKSGLGSEPFTTFTISMSSYLDINLSLFQGAFNLLILVGVLFVDRSKIFIGTIVNMFFIAPVIELTAPVLDVLLPGEYTLGLNLVIMIIGIIIVAIGIGMYLGADAGLAPYDIITIVVSEKKNIPYKWVRMAGDSICVLSALLVGGTLGIGTIATVLLLGPLGGYFKKVTENYLFDRALQKKEVV